LKNIRLNNIAIRTCKIGKCSPIHCLDFIATWQQSIFCQQFPTKMVQTVNIFRNTHYGVFSYM